jgi:hypothetical protein
MQTRNKNLVLIPQKALGISITKEKSLMLGGEIIIVYCDNHTKHMNTPWIQGSP